MGSTQSQPSYGGDMTPSFNNEGTIRSNMKSYNEKWESLFSGKSQTEVFRSIVPTEAVDFTEKFEEYHLDQFFNPEKAKTVVKHGFNCLHLYRSTFEEVDIPIFNNDQYTVVQPLGQPGRDLGENCSSKVSHLMVVKNGSSPGEITFNEMLPSNAEEVSDLEDRITTVNMAVKHLEDNVEISRCGSNVIDMANKMGLPLDTGIREFLATVISSLPDEVRYAPAPGYKLFNKENDEVSTDKGKVLQAINEVYDNKELSSINCIQPPFKNTQVLSHIHTFTVSEVPRGIQENYIDCNVILKIKKEMLDAEGQELTRTMTSR